MAYHIPGAFPLSDSNTHELPEDSLGGISVGHDDSLVIGLQTKRTELAPALHSQASVAEPQATEEDLSVRLFSEPAFRTIILRPQHMRQGLPRAGSSPETLPELSAEEVAALCLASNMTENSNLTVELSRDQGTDSNSVSNNLSDKCQACKDYRDDVSQCNICRLNYCDPCWDQQIVHREMPLIYDEGSDYVPHEKTNLRLTRKVQRALRPRRLPEADKSLHQQDAGTMWFGMYHAEHEIKFLDGTRYEQIMAGYPPNKRTGLFPSLVSFVGNTGAGKSSLINLLITLNQPGSREYPKPVVGNPSNPQPTSSDVHLYQDPASADSQTPILFADSEGLCGGNNKPRSQVLQEEEDITIRAIVKVIYKKARRLFWLDQAATQPREYVVKNLYSRILYAFSDVVVFVMENAGMIEGVASQLLDWGAQAIEHTSNQAVRPHAIIVINKAESTLAQDLWDIHVATSWLFANVDTQLLTNPRFRTYLDKWRHTGRMSTKQLVEKYYSSVKVICIPGLTNGIGRMNLIEQQMLKLYTEISIAGTEVREFKREHRLLLNADQLNPYLQLAFEHFSSREGLSQPFDFVQASFLNAPISPDFSDNLLTLAVRLRSRLTAKASNRPKDVKLSSLIAELSLPAASAIMLDAARHDRLGKCETILPQYKSRFTQGLKKFLDQHWLCEFGDCQINKVSHHSGHKDASNKQIGAEKGVRQEYHCEKTEAQCLRDFESEVQRHLEQLLDWSSSSLSDRFSRARAVVVHKEKLRQFYKRYESNFGTVFCDNIGCLCCLMSSASHCLECKHVVCTDCVKDFGVAINATTVEMSDCPMHETQPWIHKPLIRFKPPAAGLRLLSLDGGGIRGIVQLVLLQQLEKHLGGRIPIQSFFDLVVGTSVGGIIGAALNVRGWSTDRSVAEFKTLCRKAFTPRFPNFIAVNPNGMFSFLRKWTHVYDTEALEDALKDAFTSADTLFGHPTYRVFDSKLAITAASNGGGAFVFGTYNRPENTDRRRTSYTWMRARQFDKEIKIWEAARASSAAPTWFESFAHRASQRKFVDGGIYFNNPVHVADQEREFLWPNSRADLILSVGTGMNKEVQDKVEQGVKAQPDLDGIPEVNESWWPFSQNQIFILGQIAIDKINSSLDSENTWNEFRAAYGAAALDPCVRLNIPLDPLPELDEVGKLEDLRLAAQRYWNRAAPFARLERLANRLLATCFYLDVQGTGEQRDGTFVVTGRILCRFIPESPNRELQHLGQVLGDRKTTSPNSPHQFPHFKSLERGRPSTMQYHPLGDEAVTRMKERNQFSLAEEFLTLRLSSSIAMAEILLCFSNQEEFPISGFPQAL
ncbi:hypothetical protein AYL99_01312 [Fonsecaea erecta]|uniref:PNPLA domain-containing protein n=1 Tax=Fonsecaea erecta TaxID=1367422 RepID=A0A178ZZM4_9EURO|nr:hypothetical protein AYL99_01312 [Fonsecaea erecta]OAP65340.1 hypothetical protein AYL99_01312 [Fonsecaea erecta]